MAQKGSDPGKVDTLCAFFSILDERAQDSALMLLRSLSFAQTALCAPAPSESPQGPAAGHSSDT